jgi:mitochondrial fission protein ELM1
MDGGQPRRRRFHADLAERGVTRPFTGRIESWTYPPLDETDRAAREVLRRFAIKHHEMV